VTGYLTSMTGERNRSPPTCLLAKPVSRNLKIGQTRLEVTGFLPSRGWRPELVNRSGGRYQSYID
jgi:hypothetical protein